MAQDEYRKAVDVRDDSCVKTDLGFVLICQNCGNVVSVCDDCETIFDETEEIFCKNSKLYNAYVHYCKNCNVSPAVPDIERVYSW